MDDVQHILDKHPIAGYNIKTYDLHQLERNGFDIDIAFGNKIELMDVCRDDGVKGKFCEVYKHYFQDNNYVEAHRAHLDAIDEAKLFSHFSQRGLI
jgi:hypothetical protein